MKQNFEGKNPVCHTLLRASAGTGKTYRLVEHYVAHLLEQKLGPENIVAITFTRKAAFELKTRVRLALQKQGGAHFSADALATAPIGNFHGLALQLLRQAGPGFEGGMGESTTILGEAGEASMLFRQACERAWFKDPTSKAQTTAKRVNDAVRILARPFQLDTSFSWELFEAFSRAREDEASLDASTLLGAYDASQSRNVIDGRLRDLCKRLLQGRNTQKDKGRSTIDAFLKAADVASDLTLFEWNAALLAASKLLHRRGKLKDLVTPEDLQLVKEDINAPLAEDLCEQLVGPLAMLMQAAWNEYVRLKKSREALDFGDVLENAVRLLKEHPSIHARIRKNFKVILVDEAQDTNQLQRSFVHLLAGFQGPAKDAFPPASLLVVGDRKQAIYTFRGADPQSFDAFAKDIQKVGGKEEPLEKSWRSEPLLIESINSLGEFLFADTYDFLQAQTPTESQALQRQKPQAIWLEIPKDPDKVLPSVARILNEARHVAEFLKDRFETEGRDAQYVLLLRSLTYGPIYLQALAQAGIPSMIGRGRGFYAQWEITNLIALLKWLMDATDLLSAAIFLRSPFLGLSEDALLLLCQDKTALKDLREGRVRVLEGMDEVDQRILKKISRTLVQLVPAAFWMNPREFLDALDHALELRQVLMGCTYAVQRLANLDRFWELAHTSIFSVKNSVHAFVREQFGKMHAQHPEPVASVSCSKGVVPIYTVHAAKGLEFDHVLLPDLAHRSKANTKSIQYVPGHGVVFRPRLHGRMQKTVRWNQASDHVQKEEQEELKRLLYVACTRAKKEVIFIGPVEDKFQSYGFASLLDRWRDKALDENVLSFTRASPLKPYESEDEPEPLSKARNTTVFESTNIIAPKESAFVLEVTALRDYFDCTKRGTFIHRLGLHEKIKSEQAEKNQLPLALLNVSRTRLGSAAHAVLSVLHRFAAAPNTQQFVTNELAQAGIMSNEGEGQELKDNLCAFLESEFGQTLAGLSPNDRWHEVPFQKRISAGEYNAVLHGQIDLIWWQPQGSAGNRSPILVDFKYAEASTKQVEAYQTQLEAYCLFLEHMCKLDGDIQTKLVFLKGEGTVVNGVVTYEMRRRSEQKIQDLVNELAKRGFQNETGDVPDLDVCKQKGCGFVSFCSQN